ncbi:hypothetical protein [Kineococcus sp. SYSU DK005]
MGTTDRAQPPAGGPEAQTDEAVDEVGGALGAAQHEADDAIGGDRGA